jgi:hypothetical protein
MEFAGVLNVEDLHGWMGEHSDVKLGGALKTLECLDYDTNQVVVVVEH